MALTPEEATKIEMELTSFIIFFFCCLTVPKRRKEYSITGLSDIYLSIYFYDDNDTGLSCFVFAAYEYLIQLDYRLPTTSKGNGSNI